MLHAQVYTQLVLLQYYYIMLRKVRVFMDEQRWRRNNGAAIILRLFTIYVSYLAKSFKRIAFDNAAISVVLLLCWQY